MKQKVKMLKTTLGCDDGVVLPATYFEGKEYEIGESLLAAFIDMGVVELAGDDHAGGAETRESKVGGPEETKPFDITKLNKKQLVTFAKDNFGLELDESEKKDDLLAAIAKAADDQKQAE